jgi:protoporphyrinogen oxidase
MVKIAVIGGGFTGLGTAFFLQKFLPKANIKIYESSNKVGGLASGFRLEGWEWSIEHFIHHWFETDCTVFDIAREIGLQNKLILKKTKSSCFYNGKIAQFDSAISALRFPFLGLFDRIRMGFIIMWLKFDNNFRKYEKITSYDFLKKYAGKNILEIIWWPLFKGKFGKHADKINAAWFWGRIHSRSKRLGYIEGGFQNFLDNLVSYLKKNNVTICLNSSVNNINKKNNLFEINNGKNIEYYDYVVITTPLSIALKTYRFPSKYIEKYSRLDSIGSQYFLLELSESFLDDGTYWLNVNEEGFPFMMVAEHTNFIDRKHYGGKHIIWVGKYLDYEDKLWEMEEKELLELTCTYLKKINSKFSKDWICRSSFIRARDTQPIVTTNQSAMIPEIKTPINGIYLSTMSQIYPWDRGTENALILGKKTSEKLIDDLNANRPPSK